MTTKGLHARGWLRSRRAFVVKGLAGSFEYEGRRYTSLSAILPPPPYR